MPTNFGQWMETGEKLGYEGKELREFVLSQQAIAREERAAERQQEKEVREVEQQKVREQHEFEIRKLEISTNNDSRQNLSQHTPVARIKIPKLPEFKESNNDLDAYLERFERYAKANNWPEDQWAMNLSTLLSGKALEVYSRMDPNDVVRCYLLL